MKRRMRVNPVNAQENETGPPEQPSFSTTTGDDSHGQHVLKTMEEEPYQLAQRR